MTMDEAEFALSGMGCVEACAVMCTLPVFNTISRSITNSTVCNVTFVYIEDFKDAIKVR